MKHVVLLFAMLLFAFAAAFADFDMGDLAPCNYPTQFGNPAHSITNKAWLGECVTGEFNPWPVNGDPCDDGVIYLGAPWFICQLHTVQVIVTLGPNYGGEQLFVNGWKDGNMDGDFCDTLCAYVGLQADEWIVQDVPVPGPGIYTFTFMDPGVDYLGEFYPGVFRWRLTDRLIGRMGFGFYDPFNCPDMPFCGNFAADSMGEVEDYWIEDFQFLQVTLNGFDALPGDECVTLRWSTASETNSDHFELIRDGEMVHSMAAAGNSAIEQHYVWTDNAVQNGITYMYSLVAVDVHGGREVLATESAIPSFNAATVTEYALHQNYPNPFNANTSITFDLVEPGYTTLTVYNMVGQEVATLVDGLKDAGRHTVNYDATNLPTGLYLCKLNVNGFTARMKMVLMK